MSTFNFEFTSNFSKRRGGYRSYYHPKWSSDPSAKINMGSISVNHIFLDSITPGWRDSEKAISVAFHFSEKRIYLLTPSDEHPSDAIRSLRASNYSKKKGASSPTSNVRILRFSLRPPHTLWKMNLNEYIGNTYPIVVVPGSPTTPPEKAYIDLSKKYDNVAIRIMKAMSVM